MQGSRVRARGPTTWPARAKTFVFGVLLAMCLDDHAYSLMSSSTVAVEVMQVFAFPIAASAQFPWANGTHWAMRTCSSIFQVFSLSNLDNLASNVRKSVLSM